MANIRSAHAHAGWARNWGRRFAFWFLGGALATVALIILAGAVLIASDVLVW